MPRTARPAASRGLRVSAQSLGAALPGDRVAGVVPDVAGEGDVGLDSVGAVDGGAPEPVADDPHVDRLVAGVGPGVDRVVAAVEQVPLDQDVADVPEVGPDQDAGRLLVRVLDAVVQDPDVAAVGRLDAVVVAAAADGQVVDPGVLDHRVVAHPRAVADVVHVGAAKGVVAGADRGGGRAAEPVDLDVLEDHVPGAVGDADRVVRAAADAAAAHRHVARGDREAPDVAPVDHGARPGDGQRAGGGERDTGGHAGAAGAGKAVGRGRLGAVAGAGRRPAGRRLGGGGL